MRGTGKPTSTTSMMICSIEEPIRTSRELTGRRNVKLPGRHNSISKIYIIVKNMQVLSQFDLPHRDQQARASRDVDIPE